MPSKDNERATIHNQHTQSQEACTSPRWAAQHIENPEQGVVLYLAPQIVAVLLGT